MLRFIAADYGYNVFIGRTNIGQIRDGDLHLNSYLPVRPSWKEIEKMDLKVAEFRRYGNNPPLCAFCQGTPYFPNTLPDAGKVHRQTDICQAGNHKTRPAH